jgi:hypothetical protein
LHTRHNLIRPRPQQEMPKDLRPLKG